MLNHTRTAFIAATSFAFLACVQNEPGGAPEYGSASEGLTVCPSGSHLQGIDVSSYQGTINWGAVAADNIKFGYTKATEGTGYRDPTFHENWAGMKAHGIYRGAYHFFHPGIDGKRQADFFLDYSGTGEGDMPPMLDWEVSDGISASTAIENAHLFILEVAARIHKEAIVYTAPGLWDGWGVSGSFGQDKLWVADYLYCDTGSCCPLVPYGWSNWTFWQWTDRRSIAGIAGRVDGDVFNGTEAELAKLAGSSSSSSGGGGTPPPAPVCLSALGHGVGHSSRLVCRAPGHGRPGPTPRPQCGRLAPGEGLMGGEGVQSCDGRFNLDMQKDGNLVLYSNGIALWATGTNGRIDSGYEAVMQGDGNLVVYNETGCPMWDSNTHGSNGAHLAIQDDGNLVVYHDSKALWSSGSGPIGQLPETCGIMKAGMGLAPGESLSSCGGCFSLDMQKDGNLVLYKKGGHALWSSHTNGKNGYAFNMQHDGNAVLYNSHGCALFDSDTNGHPGSRFVVQDDGNLVVYNGQGHAVWASHTIGCEGGCRCR